MSVVFSKKLESKWTLGQQEGKRGEAGPSFQAWDTIPIPALVREMMEEVEDVCVTPMTA